MDEDDGILMNINYVASEGPKQSKQKTKKRGYINPVKKKQEGNDNFKTKESNVRKIKNTVGTVNTVKGDDHCHRNFHHEESTKAEESPEFTIEDVFKEEDIEKNSRRRGRFSNVVSEKQTHEINYGSVTPVTEVLFSSEDFKDLRIHQFTVANLSQNMNITKMTMIQKKAIPALLSGNDCLIRSQTGSGKTLAYALPIIEKLQEIRPKISRKDGIHALIIVPTRELAIQTYEVLIKLVKPFTWLVPGYLIGGEKKKSEKARLRKGVTVLVGTPGRILDHSNNTRALRFDRTRWLIIDEADRLFELGYEQNIKELLEIVDEHRREYEICYGKGAGAQLRQTVLLSATLTPAVKNLSSLALKDPLYVEGTDGRETEQARDTDLILPSSLSQFYVVTPVKFRLVHLVAFIAWKCQFSEERKIIVFCGTQDMVDFHTEIFTSVVCSAPVADIDSDEEAKSNKRSQDDAAQGFIEAQIFKLHGNMSQEERTEVFKTFRTAPSGVLFCTDVASRGLDLSLVDWVVQLSPPHSVSHYGHRVGRSARVGATGSALLFLTEAESAFLAKLQEARISLQNQDASVCLEYLKTAVNLSPEWQEEVQSYGTETNSVAAGVQQCIENAVTNNKKLLFLGCKAFQSWVRFYSSCPKEMRSIFNMKNVHFGHYASSFGLSMIPSAIARCAKGLPYQQSSSPKQRNPAKQRLPMKRQQQPGSIDMSEYSSGLLPAKKSKTH